MRFDKKSFHRPVRKKENKNALGFETSHFYWSFSSDIMAVKGLNTFTACQMKTTNKSAKFEIGRLVLFSIGMQMDFNKTHSILIRFVTGPENILFAGVCVHFLSRKC